VKPIVECKGFQPAPGLKELISRLTKSVAKRTSRLSRHEAAMRIVLSQNAAHKLCRASITLDVAGKTLAANAETYETESAVREAFAGIERQLETYVAELRRQHWRKRMERHPEPEAASFFDLVTPYIDNLTAFARHVLAHAESRGDLNPDEMTPEDLVDTTLLAASAEFASRPPGSVRAWLLRVATRQLESEIRKSAAERDRTIHVEEDAPEIPRTEWVSTLGEEVLDFYQPDEDLRVEDLLPDLNISNPEQQVETHELQQCVQTALANLAKDESRALLLRYVVGLEGASLERAMGVPAAEVMRLLEDARAHLRTALVAAGCGLTSDSGKSPSTTWNMLQKHIH